MADEFAGLWRKASYSDAKGECVEVAITPEVVAVRDSKDPGGGRFTLPPDAWRGLLTVLKRD
ncbi:DUF397 domain-containing protein [Amycolatopsis sp. NPDC059090]|uniref:DUF397 domain-containing protein n=1 Tax=unclassified Amycolatopsis TaxID=2618356 RepID=UPI003670F369